MSAAPTVQPRGFASDNYAGVHPEVLAAIAAANDGHAVAYGADEWTARAEARFRTHFGEDAQTFLVFNGTGANVICLQAMMRPFEAVICPANAHINVDECGAPERIAGVKLITVATADGKLRPEDLAPLLLRVGDEHAVQPRVVSITQSTEFGTLYSPQEIRALADAAHEREMLLHMDGSRLSNAAAALDVPLRALTTDAGVDALSFGGTKNGLLMGEAVVLLRPELARDLRFWRKQSMQLASKGRFLAAQFEALLGEGDLWRRNASHANAMAARLAQGLAGIDAVRLTQTPQANVVFALVARELTARLQELWRFYVWDEATGEVRWMCSWDTTEDDVDSFVADVARLA